MSSSNLKCGVLGKREFQSSSSSSSSSTASVTRGGGTIKAVNAVTPSWEARFEELQSWKNVHGDTCVPKAEGALGRWVARQRELKRTNSK